MNLTLVLLERGDYMCSTFCPGDLKREQGEKMVLIEEVDHDL